MLTPCMESYDQPRQHICQQRSIESRLWLVVPVVMYGCESWTMKKAECQRIDAFEVWWWRLLRVLWTARRSNQSILKEISPGCPLEGVLYWSWKYNTLAVWCKELTHLKGLWCWERLRAGGEGDDRGWDGWMASLTQWTWVWVNSGSWWWTGRPGMLQFMGLQRLRYDWKNELNWCTKYIFILWKMLVVCLSCTSLPASHITTFWVEKTQLEGWNLWHRWTYFSTKWKYGKKKYYVYVVFSPNLCWRLKSICI